ncbi:MAG: carbon storage regulator [Pseudomonadales bacterium]|nr:carbon storage regulator [Pseudomonadales bacterium]
MLVLTRKVEEKVIIYTKNTNGTNTVLATIKVTETKESNVKLSIDAPSEVIVDRDEIYRKKNDPKLTTDNASKKRKSSKKHKSKHSKIRDR